MGNEDNFKKTAMRVSTITVVMNFVLTAFKLFAGIFAHSDAMISDAIHSASDVLSTFVVMIGVSIASKKRDEGHQYGHDRYECIAAIILAAFLFGVGGFIGYDGIRKAVSREPLESPGLIALIAAVASVLIKEWMYRYTRKAAKKIKSGALSADAWHHRSDAMSSIGSFAGILGARLGFPILDPIAGIVICMFIFKAALDIFVDAVNKLVDKSCDHKTEEKLRELAREQEGVAAVDIIRTRIFGSKIFVDVEVSIDGDLQLWKAHEIAQKVHDVIEKELPEVKHCMVHMNPAKTEEI